jgi:hypothetical protein
MKPTPSSLAVACVASVAGIVVGGGIAVSESLLRPLRVGGFVDVGDVPESAPRAEVKETRFDFGGLGSGQSQSHRFTITNTGGSPLTLEKGATSCTCTISGLDRSEVPPGESATVTLEWTAKGGGGAFRQQATILTSDPRRSEVAFVVEGRVIPTFEVVPPRVVFSKLAVASEESVPVRIFTHGDEPPRVESLRWRGEGGGDAEPGFLGFEAAELPAGEIEGHAGATGGLSINLTTRPPLPLGPFRGVLEVGYVCGEPGEGAAGGTAAEGETASGRATIVEIPVEGSVRGEIAVAGSGWDSGRQLLSIGSVASARGFRGRIFLTARGAAADEFSVEVEELVPSCMVVEVGEPAAVGSGSVVRLPLTISIPPGSPPCNHLGTKLAPAGRIVLRTQHPDAPTMTIPVRIAVGP